MELHFTAINMTKYDDPDSLNFQAKFEFIKPMMPDDCKDNKRKLGSEGTISLNEGDVSRIEPTRVASSISHHFSPPIRSNAEHGRG